MVDYYWLKSFTEILQLFIAVLFLIYIKVKYTQRSPLLMWLSGFLVFKSLGDLYGVINYTRWIETLVTQELLDFYRLFMAFLELGMLAAYVLFTFHLKNPRRTKHQQDILVFLPALLIAPLNLVLVFLFESNLLYMFILVRSIFIGTLIYLLLKVPKDLTARSLTISMMAWNVLWLVEVILHEQFSIISSSTSWILFVLSEVTFTFGITYFLIQVIANPKILRNGTLQDSLPASLIDAIKTKLGSVICEEKIYRDSNLSLAQLSDVIGIPSTDLTNYLNRVLGKNFNQYLTQFRINESIQLLENSDEYLNIEQIMHQVGFNSKSVFNTAFKSQTRLTPSAYRKRFLAK